MPGPLPSRCYAASPCTPLCVADNIATALEKQTLRAQPAAHRLTAAELAGEAGGIFLPGLGIATSLAAGGVAKHLETLREERSGRVSLGLLRDAGYDISDAPLAWRRLASPKPKPLADIPLPNRAANLYAALGTTWRSAIAPARPADAPTPALPETASPAIP